ncbi:soluble NSF attachment family protein [Spirillospora sp. NBC_00431]
MPDATLYREAAACYERARHWTDAARCYRAAGMPLRAAALHERLGRFEAAAEDYQAAGEEETAGWLLVHCLGEPAPARDAVARAADGPRRDLVLARCDLAEGGPPALAVPALQRVCADLADPDRVPYPHRDLEDWGLVVAELAGRLDQAALIFAAAVRGHRPGAEGRWTRWADRVLGTPLVIAEG